jgi:choline dehydrogenase-like flavoprotein
MCRQPAPSSIRQIARASRRMNQIIEEGRRHSMARAFSYPVMAQEILTVLVNTQVNRVILKRDKFGVSKCCAMAK